MIKKLKNKIKKHFEEVIKLKTSPSSIAIGFAIGTFFGLFPTLGLELLLIPLIILTFKKISKVSLGLAYIIWNPLVSLPFYALGYKIGDLILGDIPIRTYRFEILNQIYIYSMRFIVGNFIVAIIMAILCYFLAYHLTNKYQRENSQPSKK